ncbi:MAG: ABC transporter substrate-binding protein [Candidatus Bathyarchaeia archaeon]
MKKAMIPFLAALLVVLILHPAVNITTQNVKGFYPDEIVYFEVPDEDLALSMLKSGDMDFYLWRIMPDKASEALRDPRVDAVRGASGYHDLLFNPAPVPGKLNPFSMKEFRQTINYYLIDREFIVKELLKGFGEPAATSFSPYSPDYGSIVDIVEAFKAKAIYDYKLAELRLRDVMLKAGAVEKDGKWYYNESPVEVKFFIRSDDPIRKAMGDKIASDLEGIGFTVERIYGDLHKAMAVIYGSDPAAGEWHIYTEGWATTSIVRYDDSNPAWYYAPWAGNMPGWGEPGYWQYENPELDDVTMRLATGRFESFDERAELLRRSIELGLDESVRSFVANTFDSFPYNKERVEGFIYDLFGGPWTAWFYRGVRLRGGVGGTLRLGQKLMYQGAYNPIAGFRDLYSVNVVRAVSDPGAIPHPYTGIPIPYRYTYKVETAGPHGRLSVPPDALTVDLKNGVFKPVGSGINATTRTIFKVKMSRFHHGPQMSVADLIYSFYFMFEWGVRQYPEDPKFDGEYSRLTEDARSTFVAFRMLGEDTVELYYNYWHPDETYMGTWISPYSPYPWELYALMEDVVMNGRAAFSKSASGARGVEWLDLTKGPSLEALKDSLQKLASENYIPEALKPYVSSSEAKARWFALQGWFNNYGHFLVSNGPYYFYKADTVARQDILKAFRDPSYPYSPGDFDQLTSPRFADIIRVSMPDRVVAGGEALIRVGVTVGGVPSREAEVSYLIINPEGEILLKGKAKPSEEPGEFEIELNHSETSELGTGSYLLKISAVSFEAARPSTATRTLAVLSSYQALSEELIKLRGDISSLEEEVSTRMDTLTSLSAPRTLVYTALGLSLSSLLISIIGIVTLLRRVKKR